MRHILSTENIATEVTPANFALRGLHMDIDGIFWCVSNHDAHLYRIDPRTGNVDRAATLMENERAQGAFMSVLPYKDKLVMVPGMAEYVILFDKRTSCMEKMPLPAASCFIGTNPVKFWDGILDGQFLYMQGFSYPGILKLDLETKKFTVIDGWLAEIRQRPSFNDAADGCFGVPSLIKNGTAYFPFLNANAVLSLNFSDDTTHIYVLGEDREAFGAIEMAADGSLWLFPRDGRTGAIVRLDIRTGEKETYDGYPDDFTREQYVFLRTTRIGNNIFAFSNRAGRSLVIDTSNGTMRSFDLSYGTRKYVSDRYLYTKAEGEEIFLVGRDCLVRWNFRDGKTRILPFAYSQEIITYQKKIMEEERKKIFAARFEAAMRKYGRAGEGENFPLSAYLEYIVQAKE